VIICFKRVVTSVDEFGFTFCKPLISASIFCSSPCVNSLNVMLLPECGRENANSLTPRVNNDSFICLSSNDDKSTVASDSWFLWLVYLNV
jgi:hypothetical protein